MRQEFDQLEPVLAIDNKFMNLGVELTYILAFWPSVRCPPVLANLL